MKRGLKLLLDGRSARVQRRSEHDAGMTDHHPSMNHHTESRQDSDPSFQQHFQVSKRLLAYSGTNLRVLVPASHIRHNHFQRASLTHDPPGLGIDATGRRLLG